MDSPGPNSCIIRLFPPILAYPILSSALRRLHCGLRRLQCGLGRLHCGLRRLYCARRRLQNSSKKSLNIFCRVCISRRGLFFVKKYVKIFCRVCIFPQGPFFFLEKNVFCEIVIFKLARIDKNCIKSITIVQSR